MQILIQPLDPLFVRDGKSFSMGEDVTAQSLFPPPPSTFYGAVRSAYFSSHPKLFDYERLNTKEDPTISFAIRGIYLFDNEIEQFIFPTPLDLVVQDNSNDGRAHLLKMKDIDFYSNYPFRTVLAPPNENGLYQSVEGMYITESELEAYLSGPEKEQDASYFLIKGDSIVKTETKVGVAIDSRTGTAEESKLYRIGMKRLNKQYRFFLHFDGLDGLGEEGMLRLGGEGKIAAYTTTLIQPPQFVWDGNPGAIPIDKRGNQLFKLYFATPSYFTNGWLPSWIDPETMEGEYQGIQLELVTAVVGKHLSLGGFDMKSRYPKAMRRFIGAGSVYYFSVNEKYMQQVYSMFHNQCVSDEPIEEKVPYSQQGFGLCYVGKVGTYHE